MKLTATILLLILLGLNKTYGQNYCTPQSSSWPNTGIISFQVDTFIQMSDDGTTITYENFTSQPFTINESYYIPVDIGFPSINNGSYVKIWIDANSDYIFQEPEELIFSGHKPQYVYSLNGLLALPDSIHYNDTLRLRVKSSWASYLTPCNNQLYGQTEDYSVIILPANQSPIAEFTASDTISCNGSVTFSANSSGNPTQYNWDFGDGNSSNQPEYTHIYGQNGTYTVRLIVSNSQGSDTAIYHNYIHVNYTTTCDTFAIPRNENYSIIRHCDFVIVDDGGNGNYSDYSDGYISIGLLGAESVCIQFLEFDFEGGYDYLEIYEGNSPSGNLIGRYTGIDLPPQICTSNPNSYLCIKQDTDHDMNFSGFVAIPKCTMPLVENGESNYMLIYPNPFTESFKIYISKPDLYEISIFSITGQKIYNKKTKLTEEHIIDIAQLPSGIYTVQLQGKTEQWQKKIIKL